MSKRNITIEDVAKMAGVSRATAGRVVGGYAHVSEQKRDKVMQAVDALNYRPNAVAQGLRKKNTKTIAVIVGSIKVNYCNKLVYAIDKEAHKLGLTVIVCNSHENVELEVQLLQNMVERNVDGIILMSAFEDIKEIPEVYLDLYYGEKIPVVFVDKRIEGLNSNLIQSNNEEISYQAIRYLLSLGHRKIGILSTDNFSTARERIAGYRRAIQEAGIQFQKNWLKLASRRNQTVIREKTAELIEQEEVSAIYILNNSLSISSLMEIKELGKSISKDISMLVWDDEEVDELLEITSIVQPIEEIGRMAVKNIIEMREQEINKHEIRKTILDAHIVFRNSCQAVEMEKNRR